MAGVKHAFTNPKSDGADATVVRPTNWNADHATTETDTTKRLAPDGAGGMSFVAGGLLTPFQPCTQSLLGVTAAASVAPAFPNVPASGCLLYAQTASVSPTQNVSSIVQTNVTWTQVSSKAASGVKVELWKGVPSGGAIGQTVTVTWAGATNNVVAVTEWPSSYGLAGTAGTNFNATASTSQPYCTTYPTGVPANSLNFHTLGIANGSVPLSLVAPKQIDVYDLYLTGGHSFFAFGYQWCGSNSRYLSHYSPAAFASVWCSMIDPVN